MFQLPQYLSLSCVLVPFDLPVYMKCIGRTESGDNDWFRNKDENLHTMLKILYIIPNLSRFFFYFVPHNSKSQNAGLDNVEMSL